MLAVPNRIVRKVFQHVIQMKFECYPLYSIKVFQTNISIKKHFRSIYIQSFSKESEQLCIIYQAIFYNGMVNGGMSERFQIFRMKL